MKEITSKSLEKYIKSMDENVPIRIYCSYNFYDVKRIVFYDDKLVLEVGDSNNPSEEDDGPMLA